jgi:hypothetical protein
MGADYYVVEFSVIAGTLVLVNACCDMSGWSALSFYTRNLPLHFSF